jgi:glycosyltransferase involved in cell wall biosynthesis
MAHAIKRLIENPGLRVQLGVDGRATVDQYRWDRVADKVLGYYEEIRDKRLVPPAQYRGW